MFRQGDVLIFSTEKPESLGPEIPLALLKLPSGYDLSANKSSVINQPYLASHWAKSPATTTP